MERLTRRIPAALAAAVMILVLSTCSNPVDFRATVIDEVMVANKLYLAVSEATPTKNQTGVNTYGSLFIEFDRAIDPDSVSGTTIVITPTVNWTHSYDELTRILSITPDVLESVTLYTVNVTKGVKGTDGSSLREPYAWSFTTKQGPGGTVTISSAGPSQDFTSATGVNLVISANFVTTQYRVSPNDPPTFDPADNDWLSKSTSGSTTLPTGDGIKKVYIQFMDASNNRTPETAIYDTITLDSVNPTATSLTIAGGATYSTSTTVSLTTVASDTTSGLYQMQFSNNAGSTWSSWESWSPTKAAWALTAGDGAKTVHVKVKDYAGRESNTPSDGITLDATGPSVTTFNINANATYTNSTSSTLTISASDALSGINQVRYSSNGSSWTTWEAYAASKAWTLATGDGLKYAYYQVSDIAGNVTQSIDSIRLDQTPPTISVFTIGSGNPASTNSASVILYITATDATSGVYQSRYGNYGESWTAWEAYSSTRAWALPDSAGTRRVYIGVTDNAGNATATNGTYDEIVLNARIVVIYNQLFVSNDGDSWLLGDGEIYYYFYIDGVTKLYRTEANQLSIGDPAYITSALPPSAYTIYENPTSGSFQLTGTVYDDDSPSADDYGTMASITYSAPFADVPSAARSINGDVAGAIYYSIDFVNP